MRAASRPCTESDDDPQNRPREARQRLRLEADSGSRPQGRGPPGAAARARRRAQPGRPRDPRSGRTGSQRADGRVRRGRRGCGGWPQRHRRQAGQSGHQHLLPGLDGRPPFQGQIAQGPRRVRGWRSRGLYRSGRHRCRAGTGRAELRGSRDAAHSRIDWLDGLRRSAHSSQGRRRSDSGHRRSVRIRDAVRGGLRRAYPPDKQLGCQVGSCQVDRPARWHQLPHHSAVEPASSRVDSRARRGRDRRCWRQEHARAIDQEPRLRRHTVDRRGP